MTKSSAKHQSLLSPWVIQHQPWPQSIPLYFLLLILDRTDVCSPLLCLFPTQFCAKIDLSRKNKTYRVVTVTPPSLQGLHASLHTCWAPMTVHLANRRCLCMDQHASTLKLRSLRFHSPCWCRIAVFLTQTKVSLRTLCASHYA